MILNERGTLNKRLIDRQASATPVAGSGTAPIALGQSRAGAGADHLTEVSTPSIIVGRADRAGVERIAIGDRRGADAAAPNNIVRGIDDAVAVVVAGKKRWNIGRNLQQTSSEKHRAL